jgi:hypothetical protein
MTDEGPHEGEGRGRRGTVGSLLPYYLLRFNNRYKR